MNKKALINRTARAAVLADRYRPAYRIIAPTGTRLAIAKTRDEAREQKRAFPGAIVEKRQADGSYTHIR